MVVRTGRDRSTTRRGAVARRSNPAAPSCAHRAMYDHDPGIAERGRVGTRRRSDRAPLRGEPGLGRVGIGCRAGRANRCTERCADAGDLSGTRGGGRLPIARTFSSTSPSAYVPDLRRGVPWGSWWSERHGAAWCNIAARRSPATLRARAIGCVDGPRHCGANGELSCGRRGRRCDRRWGRSASGQHDLGTVSMDRAGRPTSELHAQ